MSRSRGLMRWTVEIHSVGDEEALRRVLELGGGKLIHADARAFWLPDFETCESADTVWAAASRFRERLCRFGELDAELQVRLVLGPVCEHLGDGSVRRHHFLTAETGVYTLTGFGTTLTHRTASISEDERQEALQRAEERARRERREKAVKLAAAAAVDERVLQVMELLQVPDPTGTQLGHIVDLIRDARGGDLSAFATENEMTRFERSINHPKVMGLNARHATSKQEPPPNPMQHPEATLLARDIARKWLDQL
jgi:hypothetical protein